MNWRNTCLSGAICTTLCSRVVGGKYAKGHFSHAGITISNYVEDEDDEELYIDEEDEEIDYSSVED